MARHSQRLTDAQKKRLIKKGKKRGPRGTTLLTSPLKDSIISGEAAPDLYEPKDLNFLRDAIDPKEQATARPLRQVAEASGENFANKQTTQPPTVMTNKQDVENKQIGIPPFDNAEDQEAYRIGKLQRENTHKQKGTNELETPSDVAQMIDGFNEKQKIERAKQAELEKMAEEVRGIIKESRKNPDVGLEWYTSLDKNKKPLVVQALRQIQGEGSEGNADVRFFGQVLSQGSQGAVQVIREIEEQADKVRVEQELLAQTTKAERERREQQEKLGDTEAVLGVKQLIKQAKQNKKKEIRRLYFTDLPLLQKLVDSVQIAYDSGAINRRDYYWYTNLILSVGSGQIFRFDGRRAESKNKYNTITKEELVYKAREIFSSNEKDWESFRNHLYDIYKGQDRISYSDWQEIKGVISNPNEVFSRFAKYYPNRALYKKLDKLESQSEIEGYVSFGATALGLISGGGGIGGLLGGISFVSGSMSYGDLAAFHRILAELKGRASKGDPDAWKLHNKAVGALECNTYPSGPVKPPLTS